jgi:8-oxo-dGTP pyrophosphatase MutT (NUDIX family)
MPKEIQRFDVGTKAYNVNERGEMLMLRESASGQWELPGGRIDVGEERTPLDLVLKRELAEELGPELLVDMGPLVHTWARERKPNDFVFLVGRLCRFKSGTPKLSDEHDAWAWVADKESEGLDLVPSYREAIAEFRKQLPRLR